MKSGKDARSGKGFIADFPQLEAAGFRFADSVTKQLMDDFNMNRVRQFAELRPDITEAHLKIISLFVVIKHPRKLYERYRKNNYRSRGSRHAR